MINWIQCNFKYVNLICRDKLHTGVTLGKWLVKIIFLIVTAIMLKNYGEEQELENVPREVNSNLVLVLFLYALQIPIYLVARLPIFIVFTCLTCCCDTAQEVHSQHDFKNWVIHLDYIDYETSNREGFENHVGGLADVRF